MSCYVLKKILLFLIFPGVTRSSPQRQQCFLGQCNQNNIGGGRGFGGLGLFGNRGGNFQRFPSFNPSLNIQNCVGSQCNQNNVGGGGGAVTAGGSFFGGPGGGSGFPSFNPSLNIQNCRGSQCGQNNFRKKRDTGTAQYKSSPLPKRIPLSPDDFSEGFPTRNRREGVSTISNSALSPAVSEEESPGGSVLGLPAPVSPVSPVSPVKKYECAGALVSSTCLNSHCRIICSDGVKYDADCGKKGTSLSSSPGSPGKTLVTVTCGGDPLTFPDCFPFCPASTQGPSSGPPSGPSAGPYLSSTSSSYSSGCSTTSLASCISGCPQSARYQACVSACLGRCSSSQLKYNTNLFTYSPFPPCFPFCGAF